jgi:uncharacterized protein (DUF305 family)
MFLFDPRHHIANRLGAAALVAAMPLLASAEEPGRGLTADFEVRFMKEAIDHHFAALRMTELAAGTDLERDPEISPVEGTSPTPDAAATPPKAKLDEVKSLARRNNRMQREEILMTRMLLRDWYGIDHEPQLSPMSQAAIELLERAHPGAEFDHLFLEVFARHHFVISARATECLASLDLSHDALRRMCRSILEAQLVDIEEMRDLLCREYRICDLLPLTGIKGRHSGREGRGPGGHDWHR